RVSFFLCYDDLRLLPSFPTRRSSDLRAVRAGDGGGARVGGRVVAQAGHRAAGRADAHLAPAHAHERADLRLPLRASGQPARVREDRKSTRLNSSHVEISYAVFCLKKK